MSQVKGGACKETDMPKFWLVDPSVKWELVRFRSIRHIDDRCMAEGILAVRHSPNSQLYRVFADDDIGVNRSVALYSVDPADRGLESNVDANIVYTASSPWGEVTPKTTLTELPPIRPASWGIRALPSSLTRKTRRIPARTQELKERRRTVWLRPTYQLTC